MGKVTYFLIKCLKTIYFLLGFTKEQMMLDMAYDTFCQYYKNAFKFYNFDFDTYRPFISVSINPYDTNNLK